MSRILELCGIDTLQEIEAAVPKLSSQELIQLEEFIRAERKKAGQFEKLSVLDIPAASVGRFLRVFPFEQDDDLLGEMLTDRA